MTDRTNHDDAAREAARLLASRHRIVGWITCERCGARAPVTSAARIPKRYCSVRCAKLAYRQAHREKVARWQRERRARRRAEAQGEPGPTG